MTISLDQIWTAEEVQDIRAMYDRGIRLTTIQAKYGKSLAAISNVGRRISFAYLPETDTDTDTPTDKADKNSSGEA